MDFDHALREVHREDFGPYTAMQDIERQRPLTERHGHATSLDSMWRAAGSPTGRDPTTWSQLAKPLLIGIAAYFANLQEVSDPPVERRRDWRVENLLFKLMLDLGPNTLWRVGDVMAVQSVAIAYAQFLDRLDSNG